MDIKTYFSEKLSVLLFLEIKKDSKINDFVILEDIYFPVRTNEIIQKVKNKEDFDNIPVNLFIEGMFYVLGADELFKYNKEYKQIINTIPNSIGFIKGVIFKEIQNEKYEEAFIFLKGLLTIEENKDNYDKIFLLVDKLRATNSIFKDEQLKLVEKAKQITNYSNPYLYEALVLNSESKHELALIAISNYTINGGEQTEAVIELKNDLETITNFQKAKDLVSNDPKGALEIFIPLMEQLGDRADIYYHTAVAYRNLQNYEKAIYYLNEAQAIDNDLIEVVNEFGINYACLENYEAAIQYFRKAFEVTKSIEICTNLVMCYLNVENFAQARIHLDMAKKIDPQDEIVMQLENQLAEGK
ncbi:capsular biosynthesis protein [Clostridium sp. CF011]|uniref:tetratricopeptide repeat protein n=1 Tax=Clostridium sp. CF011 TaxID=2843318 RepID=UPI001C0B1136|nr:capsular biosynthesis protein [Clostridium sp. CF011]MBU3092791.1 capsular biosynthesis protein [Clostridium sp. CF011]WAG70713.1 capsular biosynthesis protein [Clostridium sp. CF011]